MIILIGAEKGGSGKSTLAVNVAALAAADGYDVLLVDADRQASANSWAAFRAEAENVPRMTCITKTGKGLKEDVLRLATKHNFVVIDSGGQDSVELRQSMLIADRMVIPTRASQFDAWSLDTMNELVESARGFNEKLDAMVVINCASPNPRISEADDLREMAESLEHLRLANSKICDRIAFRKCIPAGLAVTEMRPVDPKAAFEIRKLFKEITQ